MDTNRLKQLKDLVEMGNWIEMEMDTVNGDIDKSVPGKQADGFPLPV